MLSLALPITLLTIAAPLSGEEWKLWVALKNQDLTVRADAIRGLGRMKSARVVSGVMRAAEVDDAGVRDAAGEYLFALGDAGKSRSERMFASPIARERAIAIAAMLHRSAEELAPSMFRIAEQANSNDAELAGLALTALAKIKGPLATNLLASAVSDPETKEVTWLHAAELLRTLGSDGVRELISATGRVRDYSRRATLVELVAKDASNETLEALVDSLDDPSVDRRTAAQAILARTGDRGREVARARCPSALPELELAIEQFLNSRLTSSR